MSRTTVVSLPASLRGMLAEQAAADATVGQKWILSLLQRHGPGVVSVLWRMLGREQDVLDAYQGVVCQLAARGPKGIGINRGGYFYRSAMNAAIEVHRRRRRENDRLETVARRQASLASSSRPAVNTDHLRLVEQMRSAVLALPKHLRDVVVLRDLAGLDYGRVSAILKITSGTARVYRRQAIIRLSAKLTKEES